MEENKNKLVYIILIVIGGVILFLGGLLAGTQIKKNPEASVNGTVLESGMVVPELCASLIPPEDDETFGYSGRVIKIGGGQLVISTELIENYEIVTKEITVKVDGDTKLVEIDPSIPPPMPKEGKEGEEPEIDSGETDITFDKINEDSLVNVSAPENIKGQAEFTADKVVLIIEQELPEPPPAAEQPNTEGIITE